MILEPLYPHPKRRFSLGRLHFFLVSFLVIFIMDAVDDAVERLRSQITAVESELSGLRSQLAATEQIATHKTQPMPQNGQTYESVTNEICPSPKVQHYIRTWELEPQEYKRYGRQLIMPEVGIRGGFTPGKSRTYSNTLGNRSISSQESISINRGAGRIGLPRCCVLGRRWRWKDRLSGRRYG